MIQGKPVWVREGDSARIFLTNMVSTGSSRWVISDDFGYFSTQALPEQNFPPLDAVWNYLALGAFDDSYRQEIKLLCVDTVSNIIIFLDSRLFLGVIVVTLCKSRVCRSFSLKI